QSKGTSWSVWGLPGTRRTIIVFAGMMRKDITSPMDRWTSPSQPSKGLQTLTSMWGLSFTFHRLLLSSLHTLGVRIGNDALHRHVVPRGTQGGGKPKASRLAADPATPDVRVFFGVTRDLT